MILGNEEQSLIAISTLANISISSKGRERIMKNHSAFSNILNNLKPNAYQPIFLQVCFFLKKIRIIEFSFFIFMFQFFFFFFFTKKFSQ